MGDRKTSEAQLKAVAKYEKANREKKRVFSMKMSKETDADVIEKLESVDNIQGYIKELIRKDISHEVSHE